MDHGMHVGTDHVAHREQGNGYPRKSPSVPNFHDKTYTGHSMSEPALQKSVDCGKLNVVEDSSLNDGDANLSVIDLYGDEVESRRVDEMDYLEDEDEEADSDEFVSPPVPFSPTNASSTDAQFLDRYGFKKQNNFITEEEYNKWWGEYSQYCIRRKHKWKILLEKSGLPMDNDSPNRFPSRSEKLKRYVRKGIPAEWRGNAWWYFARGQEKLNKNKGVYDKLLSKMEESMKRKKKSQPDLDIIERDLNRTFPDNIHFQRETFQSDEPQMIKSLRRVLVAFSLYNPKIGYCQSMNFLAGLLLLFMDEEKAFWMLVIITSRYLPGVHNVNLEGVNIDQGVLMLCVKEYLPEIWQFIVPYRNFSSGSSVNTPSTLGKNEFLYKLPPITLCTASWFMSCFVGVLPVESTLRIWDCLFYEESHFLFKASLAILKLSEQELLKNRPPRAVRHSIANSHSYSRDMQINQDESEMEVFQVIQTFPKQLLNPNEIFDKIIFKRRVSLNRLDQEEIDRCRKYVTSQRLKYKNYSTIIGSSDRNNKYSSMSSHHNTGVPNVKNGGINNENSLENTTGEVSGSNGQRDSKIASDLINDALSSEVYGFKKGLSGVHWNNSIKEKVRKMRKKKGKDDELTTG